AARREAEAARRLSAARDRPVESRTLRPRRRRKMPRALYGIFLDRMRASCQTRPMRIGVLLTATGLSLAMAGSIAGSAARADGPQPARRSGLVPVVSDDEAEWAKERPPAYLAFGSAVSSDAHVNADLFLEGGMRVATTPIWVHGLIGSGAETRIQDQGRLLEARGGIELSCGQRRAVCGFFGVDVRGDLQTRRGDPDQDKRTGVVARPRI